MTPQRFDIQSLVCEYNSVFVTDAGNRLWVIKTFDGIYVVLLDATPEYPQFWYFPLSSIGNLMVTRVGHVKLTLPLNDSPGCPSRGRCGLIIQSGLRYFIKGQSLIESTSNLAILPYVVQDPPRWAKFFPHWELTIEQNGKRQIVFASAPESTRVGRYLTP